MQGAKKAQRRCIATGEICHQADLLRFAISPDGVLVPDIKATLPGRGIWITPKAVIIRNAIAKGMFNKAAKQKLHISDDIVDLAESLLLQHCLNYLQRAKIAGVLVAGFEKVYSALQANKVAILIHSKDASGNGCRKLDKLTNENVRIIKEFDREMLATTLNIPTVVHIALQSCGLSLAFLSAYERWAGFSK